MSLVQEMNQRALELGVPLGVHMDVTYRCNERCVHCYLDHDDHGEMTTAEIEHVLDQLADAGTFFLTLSGGEVLMRHDFFAILEYARRLQFSIRIKTNGVMIHETEARRMRQLGVEQVQISVYSHRPEVHDAITKLPGSLRRTLEGIEFLKAQGLKVSISNVWMTANRDDHKAVQAMAKEIGVPYYMDPTVAPMMDGNRSVLALRVPGQNLPEIFHDDSLVGDVDTFCAPPPKPGDDILDGYPCSAGHTAAYISPYGEVFPCVQFPITCGNVRQTHFFDIWKNSPQFHQVRSIRGRDLTVCSGCSHVGTCSRCPGLAYLEGDMRGPSTADCEKSFYRTGIASANMMRLAAARPSVPLVQILPVPSC